MIIKKMRIRFTTIFLILIFLLLCYGRTLYSPYNWELNINPFINVDSNGYKYGEIMYGFEFYIIERLSQINEPYCGWIKYRLTLDLGRERIYSNDN